VSTPPEPCTATTSPPGSDVEAIDTLAVDPTFVSVT
jgi:hypothetical protein